MAFAQQLQPGRHYVYVWRLLSNMCMCVVFGMQHVWRLLSNNNLETITCMRVVSVRNSLLVCVCLFLHSNHNLEDKCMCVVSVRISLLVCVCLFFEGGCTRVMHMP